MLTGAVVRRGFLFQHQVQHILRKQRAVFIGGVVLQHVVTRLNAGQRQGDVLISVVHLLLQIPFFRPVMIHDVGFEIDVTVGIHMEGDGRIAVLDFAVVQIADGDGFVDLRLLLFVRNRNGLQGAALFDEYAVRAMDRANLATLILHPDANVLVRGVNFLRQIVRPLVGIPLRGPGDRHFRAQGRHFTVRIEEAGNDLIADVQVISRNLAAEDFVPL